MRAPRRNTDAANRAREREALREDQHARARMLVDRVRSGLVQPNHLAVAGWLGDEAARLVVTAWVPLVPVPHWNSPVHHALQHTGLERPLLTRLAADCAAHVLPLFEQRNQEDLRPRRAIEAARAWAAHPRPKHAKAARAAARAAYAAAYAADAAHATDAAAAAYAAAAAAYAAAAVRATDAADAAAYSDDAAAAAYAADAAVRATYDDAAAAADADARQAEREWQRLHMIAVLCGDPVEDPLTPLPTIGSRRNSDDRAWRESERRAQAEGGGGVDFEVVRLTHEQRVGHISPIAVEWAAVLGDPVALMVVRPESLTRWLPETARASYSARLETLHEYARNDALFPGVRQALETSYDRARERVGTSLRVDQHGFDMQTAGSMRTMEPPRWAHAFRALARAVSAGMGGNYIQRTRLYDIERDVQRADLVALLLGRPLELPDLP